MKTRTTLQQLKLDSVRLAICQKVTPFILQKGFAETTVDEIARLAGMSRRSFFRYFSSKEEVVLWQFDQVVEAITAFIQEQPRCLSPLQTLQESIIRAAECHNEQPEEALSVLRLTDSTPSLRAQNLRQQERWRADLASALRAHYELGPDTLEPELAAATVLAATEIAVRCWLEQPNQSLVELLRARFRDLQGMFTQPAPDAPHSV